MPRPEATPNIGFAAARLRSIAPTQRPKTHDKLLFWLRHHGCCKVKMPQLVSPQSLVQALLQVLEIRPDLHQLVVPYAAAAKSPLICGQPKEDSESAKEQATHAACRAACRLAGVASWFRSQTSRVQIIWLCSQAYGVASIKAEALVDELVAYDMISMSKSGGLLYSEPQLQSFPAPKLARPWEPSSSRLYRYRKPAEVHHVVQHHSAGHVRGCLGPTSKAAAAFKFVSVMSQHGVFSHFMHWLMARSMQHVRRAWMTLAHPRGVSNMFSRSFCA